MLSDTKSSISVHAKSTEEKRENGPNNVSFMYLTFLLMNIQV